MAKQVTDSSFDADVPEPMNQCSDVISGRNGADPVAIAPALDEMETKLSK